MTTTRTTTTATTMTTKTTTSEYEFGFPFPPYAIQVELMQCMQKAMDESGIAILESPTGTGKTLSIICSSLSWLLHQRRTAKDQAVSQSEKLLQDIEDMSLKSGGDCDWVSMHAAKKQLEQQKLKVNAILDLISWKETRDAEFRQRKNDKVNRMLTQVKAKAPASGSAGLLMLESVSAAGKASPASVKRRQASHHPVTRDQGIVSPESLDIQQVEDFVSDDDADQEKTGPDEEEEVRRVTPQIIYACRTHSQLSQFVNEVKKTVYANQIRLVSLASRANLCVNPVVSNTRSAALINDRCMDMMRKGQKNKKHRCPCLSQSLVSTLTDEILSDVQDIEQVHQMGKELSACAYYASRSGVREADLIVMPYNILIHEKTRTSFGIDLRDTVVIIDEAHNLLDTIASVHSAEVSQEQLSSCLTQVREYVTRYNERLNPANRLHLKQLQSFIKSIVSLLHPSDQRLTVTEGSGGGRGGDHQRQEPKGKVSKSAPAHNNNDRRREEQQPPPHRSRQETQEQLFSVTDFVLTAGIDNINLFNLLNYCEKSQLARKLFAFPVVTTTGGVQSCSSSHTTGKREEKTAAGDERQVTRKAMGDMDSPSVPATTQVSGTNAFLSRIKSNVSRGSLRKDKKGQKGNNDKDKKGEEDRSQESAINDPKRLKRIVHSSICSHVLGNENNGIPVPSSDSRTLTANQEAEQRTGVTATSPLYSIIEFMKCLTNRCSDGRVLVTRASGAGIEVSSDEGCSRSGGSSLKYFLLNSSNHFQDVVTSCRSLILTGGTMKPFEELTTLLFEPMGVSAEKIITFSCGHVIPDHHLLPIALSAGPSAATPNTIISSSSGKQQGLRLNYSFARRSHPRLIEETGHLLVRLSALIPGGIVVFFPSYEYLDLMFSRWESCRLLERMRDAGKRVFREPKKASEVTRVLMEYSRANTRTGGSGSGTTTTTSTSRPSSSTITGSSLKWGGILLSVVGGKVSEGINFSDDMCRCVVMIGMPYANLHSLQLQEKMRFFDKTLGAGKGRFYYENLCFKAINQSIGRAIRHKDDYSAILLLDERYTDRRDQVKQSLAAWIADHLIDSRSFEEAVRSVQSFFAGKKRTTTAESAVREEIRKRQ